MTRYALLILPRAQKQLAALPKSAYDRCKAAILRLVESPRPRGSLKLTGRDGRRVRVGDYRIVYEIDDHAHSVTILDVGHRRDIYRG